MRTAAAGGADGGADGGEGGYGDKGDHGLYELSMGGRGGMGGRLSNTDDIAAGLETSCTCVRGTISSLLSFSNFVSCKCSVAVNASDRLT